MQVYIAAGFGAAFVLLLLIISLAVPNPTSYQTVVFKTVLALSLAGAAAVVPGFLELNLSQGASIALRAGGALAVFVIVYFWNPAKIGRERP